MLNKSFMTNFISVILIAISQILPEPYRRPTLYTGLFAFSGAITNWLAIHMLFEKVPFLYGSGIIPNKFEEFKKAIHDMMIEQFFNEDNLEKFFNSAQGGIKLPIDEIINAIPYDNLFEKLLDAIEESSFGAMLSMMGGRNVLLPMKDNIIEKFKTALLDLAQDQEFSHKVEESFSHMLGSNSFLDKVDPLITKRLDELTPAMVKELVQNMIKEHLGWLVIWGGLFGGLIGFVSSFFS